MLPLMTMPTAFIPIITLPKSLLPCPQPHISARSNTHTRRAFLLLGGLLAVTPLPTRADRTGKYSTKLTAKRRYLPRIDRGIERIRAATRGEPLQQDAMDDLFSAMQLFATTYFSEGNRVGAKERQLSDLVDGARDAFKAFTKGKDLDRLVECVDGYVREAGLGELAGIGEV